MTDLDVYSPQQIFKRIVSIGITKSQLPTLSLSLLGVLAGAFIGFGAHFYVVIVSDLSLISAKEVLKISNNL